MPPCPYGPSDPTSEPRRPLTLQQSAVSITERLDPPRARREVFRDAVLRLLDHPCAQLFGVMVVVLIIAVGGLWFFTAVGAHRLCRPRLNCQPRNTVCNVAIHVLNGLISYMAAASFPWRYANLLHLTGLACPRRSHEVGRNLYGQPCDPSDIWFHIPPRRRLGITVLLIFNCLLQLTNQIMRIIYYSYEMSQTYPGNILTKIFMVAAFSCSGAAAVWTATESRRLRKNFPKQFSVGKFIMGGGNNKVQEEVGDEEASVDNDTTREKHHRALLLANDRGSMRMFAM